MITSLSDEKFNHSDKVAHILVKLFFENSETSIFIYSQMDFHVGTPCGRMGRFSGKEVGIQMLAGQEASPNQNVESLLISPCRGKLARKMRILKTSQTYIFNLYI